MTLEPSPRQPTWFLDGTTPTALLIPGDHHPEQTTFFTRHAMDQQLGLLVHRQGSLVKRHKHISAPRTLTTCPECLILRKGSSEVQLYNQQDQPIAVFTMRAGDILLILEGGHAFTMLEDCEWVETRAGCFPGDQAKVFF